MPLTPVTVTVYCPWFVVEATVIFNVEVAEVAVDESDTLVGVRVAVKSELGVVAVRAKMPLNPLRLVNVITDEFDEPNWTVRETWLEEIEKSVT